VTSTLRRTQAEAVVSAALGSADTRGEVIAVAVVDASGELAAFSAHDGASPAARRLAVAKASSAVFLAAPTSALVDLPAAVAAALGRDLALVAGGLPLRAAGGVVVGGVGVSGADDDEPMARDGAAALAAG
jgi:glc operon protein GlcG